DARTSPAGARSQLRHARGEGPGRILSTKALLLRQIGNTLPPPFRFRPAGDLATEVEWAKNRRLTPQTYRGGLNGHEPPIPDDLMAKVFREYERRKEASGLIDFEDLLELTIRMYEEDEWALAGLRERYAAFTVDEYRTSTCSSRRCSGSGSARATTCARSATTTSRSTASPAPRRSGCSG